MDSQSIFLSFTPLAVYLLLLGLLNASRHPFLINGARDTAAFCLAISGMIIVGPMEIFFPVNAAIQFGSFVWFFLILLYALTILLIILCQRPRLIIYNIDKQRLRILLAETALRLDDQSRWAGDSLYMPSLEVSLRIEEFAPLNNITLASNGSSVNRSGWKLLEKEIKRELEPVTVPRNPWAGGFILAAAILISITIYTAVYSPVKFF